MNRPRLSILQLMFVIAIVALDLYFLRFLSWGDAVGVLTVEIVLSLAFVGSQVLSVRLSRFLNGFIVSSLATAFAYFSALLGLDSFRAWFDHNYTLPVIMIVPDAIASRAEWVVDPTDLITYHPTLVLTLLIATIKSFPPLCLGWVVAMLLLVLRRNPRPNP